MQEYQVINLKGEVIKTFTSKNQAEKFKKEQRDRNIYGLKVVKK